MDAALNPRNLWMRRVGNKAICQKVIFHFPDWQIQNDDRITCHPIRVRIRLAVFLLNRCNEKKVDLICGLGINVALEELLNPWNPNLAMK